MGQLLTRLEVAVSARDTSHWPELREQLLTPLLDASATPHSEMAAMGMMEALLFQGVHRTVSLPDVMVASIAAVNRLVVLHDDQDFDRIRHVYGHPEVERLAL